MQHKLALVRSRLATLGCATIKLHIICLRVLVHQGGWLPSKFSRWFPEGKSSISKQVQGSTNLGQCPKKFKKKNQKKSNSIKIPSSQGKKSPSTPEASPAIPSSMGTTGEKVVDSHSPPLKKNGMTNFYKPFVPNHLP